MVQPGRQEVWVLLLSLLLSCRGILGKSFSPSILLGPYLRDDRDEDVYLS